MALAMVAFGSSAFSVSILLRQIFTTIVPFESLLLVLFCAPLHTVLFGMIKFIPVKDERTGQTKRWAIGTWLHMPASHRFDLKARAAVKRVLKTTYVFFILSLKTYF